MFGDEDDDELNTFVTNLILNEARHRQNAYGVGGIDPYYSFPQPKILYKTDIKPITTNINKRFLTNIIQNTDDHNRFLSKQLLKQTQFRTGFPSKRWDRRDVSVGKESIIHSDTDVRVSDQETRNSRRMNRGRRVGQSSTCRNRSRRSRSISRGRRPSCKSRRSSVDESDNIVNSGKRIRRGRRRSRSKSRSSDSICSSDTGPSNKRNEKRRRRGRRRSRSKNTCVD